MTIFWLIILSIPLATIVWWVWSHLLLRQAGRGWVWHGVLACFALLVVGCYVWVLYARFNFGNWLLHPWLMALVMLWALLILPAVVMPMMSLSWLITGTCRLWHGLRSMRHAYPQTTQTTQTTRTTQPTQPPAATTRRQLLGTSLVAFPMILTGGATLYSLPLKRRFRIRRITATLPQLPYALDGMTIAHVSDTHVGKFTYGQTLDRLADAVNQLEADLVLMTGDLIDHSIHDLPEALGMIDRMRGRYGVYVVEGNHDLFDGREPFESGVRNHGVPLLLDESMTLRVHGVPVQLLGIRWHWRDRGIDAHVDDVARLRDPDAFPILLAHHPHAFDRAAELGLPLTLAGHTHGGQLMLTRHIGAGPVLFRYWSGLYQQGQSSLVVSNGAGNWFPLRTQAPAEIIHLTLKRSG